jgi:hypothetical protein
LIALFDRSDGSHERCREALQGFRGHFVTSWPVLTEAFHFLDRPVGRNLLWDFVLSEAVRIEEILKSDLGRMRTMMEHYSDLPMDLADASLVALAERLRVFKVFTLDRRGFGVFRPRHAESFEILP